MLFGSIDLFGFRSRRTRVSLRASRSLGPTGRGRLQVRRNLARRRVGRDPDTARPTTTCKVLSKRSVLGEQLVHPSQQGLDLLLEGRALSDERPDLARQASIGLLEFADRLMELRSFGLAHRLAETNTMERGKDPEASLRARIHPSASDFNAGG
jgi:hypothetical protein